MIETIKTENLRPHPRNEGMWGELEVSKLIEMIQLSDQITPLLVSRRASGEQFVLGGNRRLKAAEELGWSELDCRILEGLTEEQERDHLLWDNFGNRDFDGERQLEAAFYLTRTLDGTQKQKIEALAKKTGFSIPKCKKIFSKAAKIEKAVSAAGTDGPDVKKKALTNARLHGLASKTVEKSISAISEKSIVITAKQEDSTVTRGTESTLPEIEELKTELAKARRHLGFVVESFPEGEWRYVVASLDQVIDLPQIRAHIDKPAGFKMALKVNTPNPPRSLRKLFDLSFNGQPVPE